MHHMLRFVLQLTARQAHEASVVAFVGSQASRTRDLQHKQTFRGSSRASCSVSDSCWLCSINLRLRFG